jgi:hypothetical protein
MLRLAREDELVTIGALFGPALEGYRGTAADPVLSAYLRDLVEGVRERWEVSENSGADVTAIAFRYDLGGEPTGPRTVIEPGSTT